MSPPEDVCDKYSYIFRASNYASAQLAGLNIDTDHIMFIMPSNDCLDWGGAKAIGELNGYKTWIQAQYASNPGTQVIWISGN